MPLRALARIDEGAIERNCARLAALAAPAQLCAVVKADGYGHGALTAARAALEGGAAMLAVATAREAAELRARGVAVRILVMGALSPEELELAVQAVADVVAWREDFARRLSGTGLGVHVKLDTGMGRLGTRDPAEASRVAALVANDPTLRLAGVMTHFATHFDMVRCGIAIYGMDPFHHDPADHGLEPALELVSYVAEVKRAEAGDSVGYGRRFIAERDTWIATIPIGYGDGVRRGVTNQADALIGGRRVPLVGAVSMDNVTADLGDQPVEIGTEAVLIGARGGERILAEDWARALGTINYEVTCGISPRVPRDLSAPDSRGQTP